MSLERKFVTVLFADVAGSTRLATSLDPERFREIMTAVYAAADQEVTSLRGRTEKFIGDAIVAVFGVPKTHEDDALRAVRAAVAIRDRVARLSKRLGLDEPIRVRLGLASGPVATGPAPGDQLLASGAITSLAARLQQTASPGEILAAPDTWRLTREAIRFGPARDVVVRGFDRPVTARPVQSLSPRSSRRTIPLVGRRRELSLLLDTFERAREAARPHLVTILGEPGIGKSRLTDEFVAALPEGATVLAGRAGEFGEDPTLAPVEEMLRRLLKVSRDDPPERVRERLREVVTACCAPTEVERTAASLGLALEPATDAPRDHPYRVAEVRDGLASLVSGLALERPIVLIFEDLHAGRPDLLDLVIDLVRHTGEAALLVLSVARDDLLVVRPDWGSGIADALSIRLEPLSEEEGKELVRAAGAGLEEPTAERVARVAGGNPYFIVETTGMLMEEPPAGGPASWLIPPTVQAAAASRIDHLSDEARSLVRTASIFPGAFFHERDLGPVADPDPAILRRLEEAELLLPDPDQPGVWRFRHEMLRHVAYESLSKRDRVRLHRMVADARAEDGHPRAVAHHLEQAARAAADLGADDPELTERAIEALAAAGDSARRRVESRAAVDLYERALALAGAEEEWGPREGRILAGIGEARYWLGEFEEAEDVLHRGLQIGGGDAWIRSLAGRYLADVVLNVRGDPERASALFDEALAAARELGDPWAVARTLLMSGWAPYWRHDLAGARKRFAAALDAARANPADDRWAEARSLVSLAAIESPAGDEAESLRLAERALAIGREMRDPFTVGVARQSAGASLRRMMRLEEGLAHTNEAIVAFRRLDARWELASALGDRGYVHRLARRPAEAETDLAEALRLCRELGERTLVVWTTAQLALVHLSQRRVEEARALLASPEVRREPSDPGSDVAALLAEALLARAAGDDEHAQGTARRAVQVEKGRGFRNYLAATVWWAGRLFGPETAGGEERVERARRTLEQAGWRHALLEPDLVKA